MTTDGRDPAPARGRPSRAESEELLDGAGSGPLHELLAAASAPAHREEMVGEGAAVTAFLAGHRAAVLDGTVGRVPAGTAPAGAVPATGAPRRRPGRWRTPTGLASALALALATAGVAAGTAALVLHDQPPAESGPDPSGATAGAVGARPLPDAVRIGACEAWRAVGPTTSRSADPAFTDLVAAAGGTENVDGFCAATPPPPGRPAPTAPSGPPVEASSTAPAAPSASRSGGDTGASRGPARSDDGAADDDDGGPGNGNGGSGNGGLGNGGPGNGGPGNGNGGSGNGADGRGVGPPAAPPGQAERNGPANGRSVGPPAVPPGRARAPQNGDSPPGQG